MPDEALWFVAPRRVELRAAAAAEPRAGEIRVRGLASCISQGTELLLFRGEGPEPFDTSVGDGEARATYPRRYGYAWVGEVEARGEGVRLPLGARIFALAPHASVHVLAEGHARRLPPQVPALRATLAANLETALTCVWDAQPVLGERAVVLGGGVVGALVAWLLSRVNEVLVVEPSARRREAALRLARGVAAVADRTPDGGADLVIDATGHPEALDAAIGWCSHGARVVVASFYGRRKATIDLGDAFHRKRLALVSSQVSSLPPHVRGRWDGERRFAEVVRLLDEPGLDALIQPVPFAEAPQVYARLDADADGPPAHVFVYR